MLATDLGIWRKAALFGAHESVHCGGAGAHVQLEDPILGGIDKKAIQYRFGEDLAIVDDIETFAFQRPECELNRFAIPEILWALTVLSVSKC